MGCNGDIGPWRWGFSVGQGVHQRNSPHKYWRDGNPAGTEAISLFLSLHPVLHNSSPPISLTSSSSHLPSCIEPDTHSLSERRKVREKVSQNKGAHFAFSHFKCLADDWGQLQTLLPCEGGHSASGWSHTLCTEHLKLAHIRAHIPMHVCDELKMPCANSPALLATTF